MGEQTGKLAFTYQTIAELEARVKELEAFTRLTTHQKR